METIECDHGRRVVAKGITDQIDFYVHPQRIGTREKLIALYEELGQPEQAEIQRDLLAKVQQALEEQRSKTQAVSGEKEPSMKPAEPTDELAPVQEEEGIVAGGTER